MKQVPIEKTDHNFKYEISSLPGAENIKQCFSCGTCTGACPVFQVEEGYNPRRIIRMNLLVMRKEVLSSKAIWLCARCYACTAHCPQEVSFADIMVLLQDLAVKEGYAPADLPDKIERIGKAAHEFRKDCIELATGMCPQEKKDIVKKAEKTVEEL